MALYLMAAVCNDACGQPVQTGQVILRQAITDVTPSQHEGDWQLAVAGPCEDEPLPFTAFVWRLRRAMPLEGLTRKTCTIWVKFLGSRPSPRQRGVIKNVA
jgi:glucokinase